MRQWSRHSLRRGWGRIHLLSLLHDSSTCHYRGRRTDDGRGRANRPHSLPVHRSTPNGGRGRANSIWRPSGGLLVSPKRHKILLHRKLVILLCLPERAPSYTSPRSKTRSSGRRTPTLRIFCSNGEVRKEKHDDKDMRASHR